MKTLSTLGLSLLMLCVITIVIAVSLQSCNNFDSQWRKEQDEFNKKHKQVRKITLIDINGDTVVIEGGATCHIYKKR
jgi:hypothetical protein